MQSSPPTRAWERPSSPSHSHYSIDLGAFDGEGHSENSTPLPRAKAERVFSDDIEGPSDFTLNLEKWMNSGSFGRGTAQDEKHVSESLEGQAVEPENVEKLRGVQDTTGKLPEDHTTGSHHTPKNTPPRTASSWSIPKHEDARPTQKTQHEMLDSSDWAPYSQGSPPLPRRPIELHQPTVEDYYSEMIPARHSSANMHLSMTIKNASPTHIRRRSSVHSEPSTTGHVPSRPTSPSISQAEKGCSALQSNDRLEAEFQLLKEKCKHHQELSRSFKLALDEERISRKQEDNMYKTQLAEAFRREQSLTEASAEASKQAEQWKTRFEDTQVEVQTLSDRVQQQEEQVGDLQLNHTNELRELRQNLGEHQRDHAEQPNKPEDHDDDQPDEMQDRLKEIQRLKDELDSVRKQHDEEVRKLQIVARTHDHATTAFLEHDDKRPNAHHDPAEAELDRMQLELGTAQATNIEVDDLRKQLCSMTTEKQKLKADSEAAHEKLTGFEAELDHLRSFTSKEAAHSTSELQRSSELIQSFDRQARGLQQQLHDQRATNEAEAELRRIENDSEIVRLREEVSAKQSAVNIAHLKGNTLQDDLKSLNTEIASLQSSNAVLQTDLAHTRTALEIAKTALSDAEVVNAAFDAKISDTICKREKYWRARLERSEEERKLMVKQLMHLWGREELGKAKPQQFGYVFNKGGEESRSKIVAL